MQRNCEKKRYQCTYYKASCNLMNLTRLANNRKTFGLSDTRRFEKKKFFFFFGDTDHSLGLSREKKQKYDLRPLIPN